MVLERLIRCYYEKNGSFKGIENTFFYDRIKAKGLNNIGKLYEVLGFKPIEGYTSVEIFRINKAYIANDKTTLSKYNLSDADLDNLGILKFTLSDEVKVEHVGLVKLLSAYFRHSRNIFVPVSTDESVHFSEILNSLSMLTNESEIQGILKHPAIQHCIKNFVPKWVKEDVEKPYIANGKLFYNEDLATSVRNQIVKDAILDSLFNILVVPISVRLRVINLLTTNLISLARIKPSFYQTIILIADNLGLTVKQLCEACNISWIDTMEQVETTNCSITSFTDDSVKIFSIDSTSEDFVVLNNDDFKSLYERNILPTLEFENQTAYVTLSNRIALYVLLGVVPSRDLRR